MLKCFCIGPLYCHAVLILNQFRAFVDCIYSSILPTSVFNHHIYIEYYFSSTRASSFLVSSSNRPVLLHLHKLQTIRCFCTQRETVQKAYQHIQQSLLSLGYLVLEKGCQKVSLSHPSPPFPKQLTLD